MRKILFILISYIKTPQYWIKNIIWRFPKTICNKEIIFVIGTPRSGTTLLQKILEANSKLFSIQGETGLFSLQNFFDPNRKHFDLNKEIKNNFLKVSKDSVDFFDNCVGLLMREELNKKFVEKTPQHILYLKFLVKHFPKSKFIHIVRDGRDCYCSARKHPWIPQSKNITTFSKYYSKCLDQIILMESNKNVYTIKYEDLVLNSNSEVSKLMNFLNLDFEVSQIDITNISKDKRSKLKQFQKLNQNINSSSVGRWESELNSNEVLKFKKVAGKQLNYFGYKY